MYATAGGNKESGNDLDDAPILWASLESAKAACEKDARNTWFDFECEGLFLGLNWSQIAKNTWEASVEETGEIFVIHEAEVRAHHV